MRYDVQHNTFRQSLTIVCFKKRSPDRLKCSSFLQSERKNARFQRYMEDAHTIIPRLGGNDDTFSLLFMMVMEVITGLLLES